MTKKEALETLQYHQAWRKGKGEQNDCIEPKLLTEALEIAIENLEQYQTNENNTI